MPRPLVAGSQSEQAGRLIVAGVLIVLLPQLPLGNYLLYPLTILTTWFHEMGHGIAALLLSWDFERLVLLPDGSGFAESYTTEPVAAWERAAIAGSGPLAPAMFGALLILATARQRLWRPVLFALAGLLALSTLIWVRSLVGWVVLPLVALTLAGIAWRARDTLVCFTLQLLGVLGALSMLRDMNYLFSHSGVIAGRAMLSDTGAMEEALLLPHWLWAIVILALSALMIGASLKWALAEDAGDRLITRR